MIRRSTPSDVDALVSLWFEASCQAHDFVPSTFWRGQKAAMRDVYIPQSDTWVFCHENQVVGFYSLVGSTLAALFVQPEMQGQGIGAKLLSHAKSQREALDLCVYTENQRACDYYLRHGFTATCRQFDEKTQHFEYVMLWAD